MQRIKDTASFCCTEVYQIDLPIVPKDICRPTEVTDPSHVKNIRPLRPINYDCCIRFTAVPLDLSIKKSVIEASNTEQVPGGPSPLSSSKPDKQFDNILNSELCIAIFNSPV